MSDTSSQSLLNWLWSHHTIDPSQRCAVLNRMLLAVDVSFGSLKGGSFTVLCGQKGVEILKSHRVQLQRPPHVVGAVCLLF